ncbi:MAG: DUF2971 domain-containing protein [Bacteroidetes bacterium]|nr:DUF2971 domain-containing protein [Bacteroidota bacterium]MBK8364668.1 DUF2971 domain-containing protein [Bacteroidota bacterium]MBK8584459.1 DUF2971 domain-containing protein [Bacteroidota bacterium]MBK9414039.1 DUF2971 domain-containing protein [Bacteroidota bacterium]
MVNEEATESVNNPLFYYTRIDRFLFENLINRTFYFSSPKNFNDPFDCKAPMIFGVGTTEKRMGEYYDFIAGRWKHLVFNLERNEFLKNWKVNPAIFEERLCSEVQKRADEEFGILCLTTVPDSIKMWSHYADKHRGICVELDANEHLFSNAYYWKVNYPEHNHYQNFIEHDVDFTSSLMGQVLTKAKIWEDEQEFRVVLNNAGLHEFNTRYVKKIIFGVNTPFEESETIQALVEKLHYPNLEFYKAEKSKSEFKLNIVPY